ncbi:hypothetical protein E2C01_062010 [Portunus trituberculatus]|uniref:Uncharacterized protein n=1 Tax=Portunus trituberculatus TaxID=210409 RepID=A0A5B7HGV3_PORTR|nr:hypothetical protein [Portunus trituberculatus]
MVNTRALIFKKLPQGFWRLRLIPYLDFRIRWATILLRNHLDSEDGVMGLQTQYNTSGCIVYT